MTKNTVDRDVLAGLASKNLTQEKLILAVKAQLGQNRPAGEIRQIGDRKGDSNVVIVKEAAGSEM